MVTPKQEGAAVGLPTQVSPPQVALSDVAPSAVVGADVVAVPVLADEDGLSLGPGAAELVDELGDDLFALLEVAGATGKAGEVVERVVLDTSRLSNADLRLVLLVGVGTGTTDELRRAGAALARPAKGRRTVATPLGALADDPGWPAPRGCGRAWRAWCSGPSSSTGAPGDPWSSRSSGWCWPGWPTRTRAPRSWSARSRSPVPAGCRGPWPWHRRT